MLAVLTSEHRDLDCLAMATIDDQIRDWIRSELDRTGLNQSELARRSGLNKATISAYLRGGSTGIKQLGQDKLAAIERAFGRTFVRALKDEAVLHSSSEAEPHGRKLIPIVRQTRIPPASGGETMAARIRRHAQMWRISSVDDEDAFGLELDATAFDFRARDQIIFSPATPPKPGDFVCVIDADGRYQVAQYVEDGPEPFLRLPGEAFVRGLEVLGTAVDLWRSLLR